MSSRNALAIVARIIVEVAIVMLSTLGVVAVLAVAIARL